MMAFTKYPWHELIDVKRYHVFVIMPINLADIFRYFLYFAFLLNKIDVDNSILKTEDVLLLFLE